MYGRIESLVPQGEHADLTAVGEGIWLSASHLNSIEQRLSETVTNTEHGAILQRVQELEDQHTDFTEQITTLTQERDKALQSVQSKEETIAQRDETIETLQAQLKAIGDKPSGSGSTVATVQEVAPGEGSTGRPSWFVEDGTTEMAARYDSKK